MADLKLGLAFDHLSILLVQPDNMGVFGSVINVLQELFHDLLVALGLSFYLPQTGMCEEAAPTRGEGCYSFAHLVVWNVSDPSRQLILRRPLPSEVSESDT